MASMGKFTQWNHRMAKECFSLIFFIYKLIYEINECTVMDYFTKSTNINFKPAEKSTINKQVIINLLVNIFVPKYDPIKLPAITAGI